MRSELDKLANHAFTWNEPPRPDSTAPAVRVTLTGRNGRGRWMVLDLADWNDISASHGRVWTLTGKKLPGVQRVITTRPEAKGAEGSVGAVTLSHVIAGRMFPGLDGERVYHRNNDGTDLRRSNLTLDPAEVVRKDPVADSVVVEPFEADSIAA